MHGHRKTPQGLLMVESGRKGKGTPKCQGSSHHQDGGSLTKQNAVIYSPTHKAWVSFRNSAQASRKIKGSIQEEDITILNIHAPSRREPQYIRHLPTARKGEINSSTIIMGDFNTPLLSMNRSSRQKINKETRALSDTPDRMDLTDV